MPVSAAGGRWSFISIRRKSFKLPERTATLVVGNPLIADAVVQPGGVAVITAKSYGATNLVALDRNGATLSDHSILVVGPADKVVVVYRGIDRETYSWSRTASAGLPSAIRPAYFTANLGQLGAFGSQVQGGGAAPANGGPLRSVAVHGETYGSRHGFQPVRHVVVVKSVPQAVSMLGVGTPFRRPVAARQRG